MLIGFKRTYSDIFPPNQQGHPPTVLEFVPGDKEYTLVDNYRQEFLNAESQEFEFNELSGTELDQLAQRFRGYVSARLPAETLAVLEVDASLWENVLCGY